MGTSKPFQTPGLYVEEADNTRISIGTTAERDSQLVEGRVRGNTTDDVFEIVINGKLRRFSSTLLPQPVKKAAFTAIAYGDYPTDTSGGGFTVTLPALPADNEIIRLYDAKGTWDSDYLTIDFNGKLFKGLVTASKVMDTEDGSIELRYINATYGWTISDTGSSLTRKVEAITTAAQLIEPWVQYKVTMNAATPSLLLPLNPRPGHTVTLIDYDNKWDSIPLVLNGNGNNIESSSDNYVIREGNLHLDITYLDSTHGWDVVRTASPKTMEKMTMVNTDTVMLPNKRYPVDTTSAKVTLTLPTDAKDGDICGFYDAKSTFHKFSATVVSPTGVIDSDTVGAGTRIYRAAGTGVSFLYDAVNGWKTLDVVSIIKQHSTVIAASTDIVPNRIYTVKNEAAVTLSLPNNALFDTTANEIWLYPESGKTLPVDITFTGTLFNYPNNQLRLYGYYDYIVLRYNNVLGKGGAWVVDAKHANKRIASAPVPTGGRLLGNTSNFFTAVPPATSLVLPPYPPVGTTVIVEFDDELNLVFLPIAVTTTDSSTILGWQGKPADPKIRNISKQYKYVYGINGWNVSLLAHPLGLGDLSRKTSTVSGDTLIPGGTHAVSIADSTCTLMLPDMTGVDSDCMIAIYDENGDSGRYAILINGNGANFLDGSSTLSVTNKFTYITLRYLANDQVWVLASGELAASNTISRIPSNGGILSTGTEYVINNTTSIPTAKLPNNPVAGDFVRVSEGDRGGIATAFYIARNGAKINGKSADISIAEVGCRIEFTYFDDSYGWDAVIAQRESRPVLTSPLTGNTTLAPGKIYPVNTTIASITVSLPVARHGEVIELFDQRGTWATNHLILSPVGTTLNGSSTNYTVRVSNRALRLRYDLTNNNWAMDGDSTKMNYSPSVVTSSFTSKLNVGYMVKGSTVTPVTVTLPAANTGVFGDSIELADPDGSWATAPISVTGLIDGSNQTITLSGKEGYTTLTLVNSTVGFSSSGEGYTMIQDTVTASAASAVLKANRLYYVTAVNSGSLTLPSDPKRGDIIKLQSSNSNLWYFNTRIVPGTGDTIDGVNSIGILSNAYIYTFEFGEDRWFASKEEKIGSSSGLLKASSAITGAATLAPGVLNDINVTSNTTLTLPSVVGVTETVKVDIQITTAAAANFTLAINTNGATLLNSATGKELQRGIRKHSFTYDSTAGVWSEDTEANGMSLGIGATSTTELTPLQYRYNYLAADVDARFRAGSWATGTIVSFSDVEGRLGNGRTITFFPASTYTIGGSSSFVMSETRGFWVFELVGKNWILKETNVSRRNVRAYSASSAPTTNVPFTEDSSQITMTLDQNYQLTSIRNLADGNYFTGQILFKQDGSGYRTVTVPTGWRELEDSPGLALVPNSVTLLQFWYFNGTVVYSLKGDKGVDTEFPAPAGYLAWPSTYTLNSFEYDPHTSWAEIVLTFKTNGSFTFTASTSNGGTATIASGTYVRQSTMTGAYTRVATDYEMTLTQNSGSGTYYSITPVDTAWHPLGTADRTYRFMTQVGPNASAIMTLIRSLQISFRRIVKPRWSVEDKGFAFTETSTTALPPEPATFNTWSGKSYSHNTSGKDPDTISSRLTLSLAANGSFNIAGSGTSSAAKESGTYVLTYRNASMYEARVTVLSSTGTVSNGMSGWVSLGSAERTFYTEASIGPITTGSVSSAASIRLEIREKARPSILYSDTINLNCQAVAAAPTPPAGFNISNGKTISQTSTVQDPGTVSSTVKLSFNANGTITGTRQKNSEAITTDFTGTYVMPGRTSGMYQLTVSSTGSNGSLTNPATGWTALGSANVPITLTASIGPVVNGAITGRHTLTYTFREIARTAYSFSGTCILQAIVTATPPTPPTNYQNWNGKSARGASTAFDYQGDTASGTLSFVYNGTTTLAYVSDGVTTTVATGSFLLPGRAASTTQVRFTQQSSNSTATAATASTSWLTTSTTRSITVSTSKVNQNGSWDGYVTYKVDTQSTNGFDYYTGTVTLGGKVTLVIPSAPTGFNGWINQTYSNSSVAQDPAVATAELWLLFLTNGNWQVLSRDNVGTTLTVTTGTYLLPGRSSANYEIKLNNSSTSGNASWSTNITAAYTALNISTRQVYGSCTYGPVNTGSASGSWTGSFTIHDTLNIALAYTGGATLSLSAVTTAPSAPANYNTWSGSSVSDIKTVQFGSDGLVQTQLVFETNGTFVARRSGWVNTIAGTYLMPGRVPSNYQVAATLNSNSGSGTVGGNITTSFQTCGIATRYLDRYISITAGMVGSWSGTSSWTVTIQQIGSSIGRTVGNFGMSNSLTMVGRSYPGTSLAYSGYRYSNSATIQSTATAAHWVRIWIAFLTSGSYIVYRDELINGSQTSTTTLASGTFAANGVAGTAYQVYVAGSETGSGTAIGINKNAWYDINTTRYHGTIINAAANANGSYSGSGSYTVYVREAAYPSFTQRSSTIGFDLSLTVNLNPPANYNAWVGQHYTSTRNGTLDDAALTGATYLRFLTNGNVDVVRNGAATIVGSYVMPGRTPSQYIISGSQTAGSPTNDGLGNTQSFVNGITSTAVALGSSTREIATVATINVIGNATPSSTGAILLTGTWNLYVRQSGDSLGATSGNVSLTANVGLVNRTYPTNRIASRTVADNYNLAVDGSNSTTITHRIWFYTTGAYYIQRQRSVNGVSGVWSTIASGTFTANGVAASEYTVAYEVVSSSSVGLTGSISTSGTLITANRYFDVVETIPANASGTVTSYGNIKYYIYETRHKTDTMNAVVMNNTFTTTIDNSALNLPTSWVGGAYFQANNAYQGSATYKAYAFGTVVFSSNGNVYRRISVGYGAQVSTTLGAWKPSGAIASQYSVRITTYGTPTISKSTIEERISYTAIPALTSGSTTGWKSLGADVACHVDSESIGPATNFYYAENIKYRFEIKNNSTGTTLLNEICNTFSHIKSQHIDGSGGGGSGCILFSVPLWLADGTTIPIGDAAIGMEVKSKAYKGIFTVETEGWQQWSNSNIVEAEETTSIITGVKLDTFYEIYYINDDVAITKEHEILSFKGGSWKWRDVRDLAVGDFIVDDANFEVEIKTLRKEFGKFDVVTLDVEDVDNYYVGVSPILVHNAGTIKN